MKDMGTREDIESFLRLSAGLLCIICMTLIFYMFICIEVVVADSTIFITSANSFIFDLHPICFKYHILLKSLGSIEMSIIYDFIIG